VVSLIAMVGNMWSKIDHLVLARKKERAEGGKVQRRDVRLQVTYFLQLSPTSQ
jgi:hypothetical protein